MEILLWTRLKDIRISIPVWTIYDSLCPLGNTRQIMYSPGSIALAIFTNSDATACGTIMHEKDIALHKQVYLLHQYGKECTARTIG